MLTACCFLQIPSKSDFTPVDNSKILRYKILQIFVRQESSFFHADRRTGKQLKG